MADKKVTDLPAGHRVIADDLFECVQDVASTPVSNQISAEELIPGPDLPPATPSGLNDEFDDADLLPGGATPLWAWFNQGGATASVSKSWLSLTGTNTTAYRGLVQVAPAAPYKITAKMSIHAVFNVQFAGLLLVENSTGKTKSYGWSAYSGVLRFEKRTAPSFSQLFATVNGATTPQLLYLQIEDDNTNVHYRYSVDGVNWTELGSEARTDYFTADRIGIFVGTESLGICITGCDWFRVE